MKLINILNETMIYVPRKILGDIFTWIKDLALQDSYYGSYMSQLNEDKKVNKKNQELIKKEFKKLKFNDFSKTQFDDEKIFNFNDQKLIGKIIFDPNRGGDASFKPPNIIKYNLIHIKFIILVKNNELQYHTMDGTFNNFHDFKRNYFNLLKLGSSALEHELTHFIEINDFDLNQIKNKKLNIDNARRKGLPWRNLYYQQPIEFKAQILSLYREIIQALSGKTINYIEILKQFKIGNIPTQEFLFYNQKKLKFIFDDIFENLEKNKRIIRNKNEEKIFQENMIKHLKTKVNFYKPY